MEESNGELVVTVRAKNMPELRKKLLAILGETEPETTASEEDFPDSIKSIFPGYKERIHGAAMLTVLHEKHKGKENAVDSSTLAKEMIDRFPRLFKGKTFGEVSAGNVFSGNGLKKNNLIQIELSKDEDSEDEYRMYWVKP
jgi:hypothetical protein